MNPVLLKPTGERTSQVVVEGRPWRVLDARAYQEAKPTLLPVVLDALASLRGRFDVVVCEGAGSAAEINLLDGDLANLGLAAEAGMPAVVVGDIDRGGVFAALYGTVALLPDRLRAPVAGFVINKFRGDIALFAPALEIIAARTDWPCLGVLPWLADAARLPAEDSASLAQSRSGQRGDILIAVPLLSRIANFDDFDPLATEPDIRLDFVAPGRPLPGDADLIILPGSKATIADLAFLREQGWDIDLLAHHRRGGRVLGICAGYQMLGKTVADPLGIEGPPGSATGLGLLDVATTMSAQKTLRETSGDWQGEPVRGYEIHVGVTEGADTVRPFLRLAGRGEGALSRDGRAFGCSLHGLFAADGFRRRFLATLRQGRSGSSLDYEAGVEAALDGLADHLAAHLDLDGMLALARGGSLIAAAGSPRSRARH